MAFLTWTLPSAYDFGIGDLCYRISILVGNAISKSIQWKIIPFPLARQEMPLKLGRSSGTTLI